MTARSRHRAAVLAAVVCGALAAGCGGQGAPDDGAAATATTATTGTATTGTATTGTAMTGARTVEVQVAGDRVSPPPAQVDLGVGETLRLVVTSDRDSTLHAHGFEVDVPVPAGTPTSVELTGSAPGVYEVELHDPDLLLLQVAVR